MKLVRCPGCQARLSISTERSSGLIACPKCGAKMRFPTAPPEEAAEAPLKSGPPPTSLPAPPPLPKPLRTNTDDDFDKDNDSVRKRKSRRIDKPASRSGVRLAVLLGGGAVAVLAAAGFLFFFLLWEDRRGNVPPPIVQAPFGLPDNDDVPDDPLNHGPGVRPPNRPRAGVPLNIVGVNLGFNVPFVSPEAQDQLLRQKSEFNRLTLIGDYDRVGKKDPLWDDDARAALKEAAQMFNETWDTKSSWATIKPLAKRAVDAGCDDPLVLYLHAMSLLSFPTDNIEERSRLVYEAGLAMEKSAYSNYRRAAAMTLAARFRGRANAPNSPENRDADRLLEASMKLAGESARKGEDIPKAERWHFDIIVAAAELHVAMNRDTPKALAWMETIVSDFPELKPAALKTRAQVMTAYGWQARGIGFANEVPKEAWRLFDARLADARDSLQKAAQLNPRDGHAPSMMILNCKAIGRGDLNETRRWFNLAMKADPDNYEACEQLMDYLDPKWHGTPEAVIGFGQSCRDSKNWRSRITLLIADAHLRAVMRLPPGEQQNHLYSPPVREDIKSVFDEYLGHCPNDIAERCRYAACCYLCGQFDTSAEQFRLAGDNVIPYFLVGQQEMLMMRDDVFRRKKLVDGGKN